MELGVKKKLAWDKRKRKPGIYASGCSRYDSLWFYFYPHLFFMSLSPFAIEIQDNAPVTDEQVQWVHRMLKRWHIESADEVIYSPTYDNIVIRGPVFKPQFESLVINQHGKQVFNHWQLDGFRCDMVWKGAEDSEEDEEKDENEKDEEDEEPHPRLSGKVGRTKTESIRDHPYPVRERKMSKKSKK